MTTADKTPRRTVRLTHAEHYRLCEFVKTAKLAEYESFAALATAAVKALGYEVTGSNVESCLELLGLRLPAHKYREGEDDQAVRILARNLHRLFDAIGIVPEPALVSLADWGNRTPAHVALTNEGKSESSSSEPPREQPAEQPAEPALL